MTTKLDRLVTLLDTGSSALIRNEAAKQLASIQKHHPDDLFNLLTRVVPYLKSRKWDTRKAASKALEGIAANYEPFEPDPDDHVVKSDIKAEQTALARAKSEPKDDGESLPPSSDEQLQLEALDIETILTNGKKLLGSSGQQYDFALASMTPAQRLQYQKKNLTAKLGLGGEYNEELPDDAPEWKAMQQPPAHPGVHRLNTAPTDGNSMSDDGGSLWDASTPPVTSDDAAAAAGALSKRQLNMLKRKNKREMKFQSNKIRVVDFSDGRSDSAHAPQQDESPMKSGSGARSGQVAVADANGNTDYFSTIRTQGDDDSKIVAEFKGDAPLIKSELEPEPEQEGSEWPFERLCDFLMVDMFDSKWEIRHGAAMALRDILVAHGGSAGRTRSNDRAHNDLLNKRWLEDLASRLCCIFMLDRFADFGADNMVSPVRETAGQTLSVILKFMQPSSLRAVYHVLEQLIRQDRFSIDRVWQACHGGMLGLRYMVAIRTDFFLGDELLMNGMLDLVIEGLAHNDDDVRAVSAATLIPVADDIVKRRPAALPDLIRVVWDCLSDLSDDLSASTGFVMDLLAKLSSFNEVLETMKVNAADDPEYELARLVPRLFPFLRHTILGVRMAVLRALRTFLGLSSYGQNDWIDGRALRLLFQNLLVERNDGVLQASLDVWQDAISAVVAQSPNKLEEELTAHLQPMITLTLHPIGVPRHHLQMPAGLLIRPSGLAFVLPVHGYATSPTSNSNGAEPPLKRRRKSTAKLDPNPPPVSASNIDNPMIQGDIDLVGFDTMTRARLAAAQGLARVISLWPDASRLPVFRDTLIHYLRSPYSTSRVTAAVVAEEYGKLHPASNELASSLAVVLRELVEEDGEVHLFAELRNHLASAQQHCLNLRNVLEQNGKVPFERLPHLGGTVAVAGDDVSKYSFSLQQGQHAIGAGLDKAKTAMTAAARITASEAIELARLDAKRSLEEAGTRQAQCCTRVKAASAAAIVAFKDVPKKPSAVIKGIMDSIKVEENVELQQRSAAGVVALIQIMVTSGRRVVVEKVVGNLVSFYCQDASETPDFRFNAEVELGLLSLRKEEDIAEHADPERFAKDAREARIQRRGAKLALEHLCTEFGPHLFDKVPLLRSQIAAPLQEAFDGDLPRDLRDDTVDLGQKVVDSMSTLRAMMPKLSPVLHGFVRAMLPNIVTALKCRIAIFRYAAAKCIATICSVIPVEGFTTLVKEVLPVINNAIIPHERQGVIECIYHLIHTMADGILPYVIFLIVPVLGRMSDSDNDIRLIATTAFATLVKLVPLEAGIPDPPGLPVELLEGRERERKFMAQMLDVKKVEPFPIPVAIKAELRSYQQDGVNWLAFLNRYHLHGILCDDMGLGKTLQTICIVASDHHLRAAEYAKTKSADSQPVPSLIVCPPTLAGHWLQELKQYAPFLKAVAYVGNATERERARLGMKDADVVITSYEICRNAIDILAPVNWNYCVLDEGHLIKNPTAKITLAVKRFQSNHRLILSGTPIQNNVLELWSLFDFLMPGFLGTEKVFKDRFAKPIAASRFSKSSSREQEAGALATEALHKQVLPFLLRRLKDEVLDDLPPKIIQNYYCELSDLQRTLFDAFTRKAGKALSEKVGSGEKEDKQHIFQALQYMRKLCNSPRLVLKGGGNEADRQLVSVQKTLRAQNSDLSDPVHAPKLGALRQLLVDCGIGIADVPGAGMTKGAPGGDDFVGPMEAVSQHRALIFCQMKEMLDMVQTDVLQKMLPSVSFLRMDGSVEPARRQAIVNKFNSDPSIDVLLLTTSVGGLGLNLTGADTVIFVEHDWNPQKDIQAMDRAHRIGQKKVVNVYRLITRGTLEEKILSLQRFKIDVASTVVNQQNAGLATMETDQILDLFSLGEAGEGEGERAADEADGAIDEVTGEVRQKGKEKFLEGLDDLWDEDQYDEEFNLDGFLSKMR